MTQEQEARARTAFETAVAASSGSFDWSFARHVWDKAWSACLTTESAAIRNAALEEAARKCEFGTDCISRGPENQISAGRRIEAVELARKIRALKTSPEPPHD
jgi:hypothetical protein